MYVSSFVALFGGCHEASGIEIHLIRGYTVAGPCQAYLLEQGGHMFRGVGDVNSAKPAITRFRAIMGAWISCSRWTPRYQSADIVYCGEGVIEDSMDPTEEMRCVAFGRCFLPMLVSEGLAYQSKSREAISCLSEQCAFHAELHISITFASIMSTQM